MSDVSRVHRQASEWFITIHAAEDPLPELVQGWLDWLETDEGHQRAFDDIVRIWHSTTPAIIACHRAVPDEAQYDGSISVAEWRARERVQRRRRVRDRFLSPLWRRGLSSVAAGLVLVCIGSVILLHPWALRSESETFPAETFETHTGERHEWVLPDGSVVALGPRSRLSVAYTAARRQIRLDVGEAFFRVKKNPHWPFTVMSLNGRITAVGTAFDVRAIADRVTVTVREGTVAIGASSAVPAALQGASPTGLVRVTRGEQAVYDSDRPASDPKITRVDPSESARWQEGWLVYRNEPLKYVIADLSRYANLNVDVAGSAGELRFSGTVAAAQISEWIVALPGVSPVQLQHQGDHIVIKLLSPPATAR